MRIGIFGGTFDPIHNEHIRFAQAAIDCLGLDTLFIMPAHQPPHKPGKMLSSNEDRLTACRLAFAEVDKAVVSDFEMNKGGTSYTYLTCRHFKEKYPSAQLFWLVGTDMLWNFPTWKNPEDILQNATLAVCGRNQADGWVEQEQAKFFEKFGQKFAYVAFNGKNVSSTKIRVLAGAGASLTEFLPPSVAEYITKKGLYTIPFAQEALALETPQRQAHSLRVAELAARRAIQLKLPEKQAIAAALMHDCGKNVPFDSPLLKGFVLPKEYGNPPKEVVHQFTGAYLAETQFGVTDEDVLNAIRFHTSARGNMSQLEKLIFLADMLEEGRSYDVVDDLRALFWREDGLDACLEEALRQTLLFLQKKGGEVYPLTQKAYNFYKKENE